MCIFLGLTPALSEKEGACRYRFVTHPYDKSAQENMSDAAIEDLLKRI